MEYNYCIHPKCTFPSERIIKTKEERKKHAAIDNNHQCVIFEEL
jgi:hypothetical protein